ncbi:MAG TPA: beta-ketoacyl synthase N-terminal-like domain-containing protein, partial [Terracidiphilus sp.]|nr:beta-ketoacyl synthase N-terminal-like domain-containing protein [Terracidiphilus sp.]
MNTTPDRRDLLKKALAALEEAQSRLEISEGARHEPVAIIGLACRFPQAGDSQSFWRLLDEGVDAITEVPPERWPIDQYYDPDPDKPGKMYTRWGGFLENVDCFDASAFRISPREAASMDPQQRLLLELCWEALENAGIPPLGLRNKRTGVFVGISTNDYAHYTQLCAQFKNPGIVDAYTGTGNAFSVAAGRVSHFFGIQGPSIAIDTACSSSLVAADLACQHLRSRRCDMAISGGVNVILSPGSTIYFSKVRAMAADGRCKTFDSTADGYVRGEGCGIVILKRMSDAQRDGDRVMAVILGAAVNHDGPSSGLTVPNGHAQEAVIRAALADAAVQPSDIDYVEAHGTGTPLGDPIEVRALSRIFAPSRPPNRPLLIGSVKTNIGHLEAAAGVAGLIKLVLSLRNGRIPRHLHLENPNPNVEWNELPIRVANRQREWRPNQRRRRAGISSFGFGGTNAHLILEEAEEVPRRHGTVERPLHLLALSARTVEALSELARRYLTLLSSSEAPELPNVAYCANAGRSHLEHRIAVVAGDLQEARDKLEEAAAGRSCAGLWKGLAKPLQGVMFLFRGENTPNSALSRTLYDTSRRFAQAVDRCSRALKHGHGFDLEEALWGAQAAPGPFSAFVLQWALTELWRSWGIEPSGVCGDGPGEYLAGCLAGAYSVEEALDLLAYGLTPSSGALLEAVQRIPFRAPEIPWFSGVKGAWIDGPVDIGYWRNVASAPVPPLSTAKLQQDEREAFLEFPLRPDWDCLLERLADLYVSGVEVDWRGFDSDYARFHVEIPTYPFERQRYWQRDAEREDLEAVGGSSMKTQEPGAIRELGNAAAVELAALIRSTPASERKELLTGLIQTEVASVLGLGIAPGPRQGFFDLGMDSLMAVELRRRLEELVGSKIPSTMAFDYPNSEAVAQFVLQVLIPEESDAATPTIGPRRDGQDGRIAVVGLSCRFPGGANDPEAFWSLLEEGRDAVGPVPFSRWAMADFFDSTPDTPGKSYVREAAFLDIDITRFDSRFFGISPREAAAMDPQQRLFLELCWEALENAGQSPQQLEGQPAGVYLGINTNDYSRRLLVDADPAILDAYTFTGNTFSVAAGRVSHVLGLHGPSLAIDTACSSSLMAVHLAVQSLRYRECDLALAGGVNLMLSADGHIILSRMHALARDGRCKAFDASADGYGRGEGAGVVVLKRFADAERNGDKILAVIRGSAVNHDGPSSGLTVPNGAAQRSLLRHATADAGVAPAQVTFVETHGTGTPLGDPIEMEALRQVYGAGRTSDHPVYIGAVKTNIGHLEAAAGIASLIKTVLSLQHRRIPAHLHFIKPSPHIAWDELPVRVATETTQWSGNGPLLAGISSFGMSGTNVHVILEEGPSAASVSSAAVERRLHLLALSARSETALQELVAHYD